MNPIRYLRRFVAALAALAGVLLAVAVATPAAFASGQPPPLPPIREKHPPLTPVHIHQPVHQAPVPAHTVIIGGMPGWQIALIAIGAALLAAIVAVLVDRAWAARRKTITAAA